MPSCLMVAEVGIFFEKMTDFQHNPTHSGDIEKDCRKNKASDQARRLFDLLGNTEDRHAIIPKHTSPWP